MPLRDHFRPPVWTKSSWEGFHGGWPAMMVLKLVQFLPDDFMAEPRVHLGAYVEFDVSAPEGRASDAALPDQYEYAVHVYDHSRGRQLVAAVGIVCPANKDRPESRRAFVSRCKALLRQGVCVSVVDLVTTRRFNLYADLLAEIGCVDSAFAPDPPCIYAVTCHVRTTRRKPTLETWAYPLTVGQPLPTLPVWLSEDLNVPLELESTYELTCQALRIP